MPCRWFSAMPLSEYWRLVISWTLGNISHWSLNPNTISFVEENELWSGPNVLIMKLGYKPFAFGNFYLHLSYHSVNVPTFKALQLIKYATGSHKNCHFYHLLCNKLYHFPEDGGRYNHILSCHAFLISMLYVLSCYDRPCCKGVRPQWCILDG